ncbi:MAG: lysine--tRNA ligase [Deltaproteobacteria bacterium]|nr:lysine--tRNA ligase [Deltaproteobacteria bacterium]
MEERSDQQQIRLDKLKKLRELGVEPYPYRFRPTHRVEDLLAQAEPLLESATPVSVAGRLMASREMGKAAFAHFKDNHHRMQCYVRQDTVSAADWEIFGLCDLGDYVGLHGTLMRTKTGELTVRVERLELLSKALRPLPVPKVAMVDGKEVVHQEVRDVEFRYRQRYADLALNDEVARVFLNRTRIIQSVRAYLVAQGYLEVETPILQPIYGGAAAMPFTTHHKALDLTLYLRIATELYLKRLVAGGFDRVFEIGKDFRNEGIDRSHNPEFTMVEFYEAYADYHDMMDRFEAIWEQAALAVHGDTRFTFQEHTLDVKRPWKRLTMAQALKDLGGVDFAALDDAAVKARLKQHDLELEGDFNRGLAMAALFEALCEPKLIQPTFIIDFPKETTPLCKAHRSDPQLVERFEPYIAGWEVGNAYSELNDPVLQKALFEEQVARRHGGHLETHPFDGDFLRAMEYGMPPMGGVGIGIDRMAMLLLNQPNIRDVLFFPTLRPESHGESD